MFSINRLSVLMLVATTTVLAIGSSNAGNWKTWVIQSGAHHAVPEPPTAAETRQELQWIRNVLSNPDPRTVEQIRFWDSGPPSYRWMDLVTKRQTNGQALGAYPLPARCHLCFARDL